MSEAAVGRADTAARRWRQTIGNGDYGGGGHGGHHCSWRDVKKQQSTTIFIVGGDWGGGVVNLAAC